MAEVKINVRDNGPLLVEGAISLFDGQGKEYPLDSSKPTIALCRCGHSAKSPFCDGSHKTSGFQSAGRAPSE